MTLPNFICFITLMLLPFLFVFVLPSIHSNSSGRLLIVFSCFSCLDNVLCVLNSPSFQLQCKSNKKNISFVCHFYGWMYKVLIFFIEPPKGVIKTCSKFLPEKKKMQKKKRKAKKKKKKRVWVHKRKSPTHTKRIFRKYLTQPKHRHSTKKRRDLNQKNSREKRLPR